jgi:hypothetical protein
MPIRASCPNCRKSAKLQESWLGQKVRCPRCKQEFVVAPSGSETVDELTAHAQMDTWAEIQAGAEQAPTQLPPVVKTKVQASSARVALGYGRRRKRGAWKWLVAGLIIGLFSVALIGAAVYSSGLLDKPDVVAGGSSASDKNKSEPGTNDASRKATPILAASLNAGKTVTPAALATGPRGSGQGVKVIPLSAGAILPCLCWTPDGKSFLSLENNGTLRRVSLEGFKEEQKVELGEKCSWLAVSSEGPVVTLPERQEVWVLTSGYFEVKKKIPLPSVVRVACAPGLPLGFAVTTPNLFAPGLHVIDLQKGQVVKAYKTQDFPDKPVEFGKPAVTQDGKYLMTMTGNGQLHRFKISGPAVTFEESGLPSNGQNLSIAVSPDGAFVCQSGSGKNGAQNFTTDVYAVTNFVQPTQSVSQEACPLAEAFDPKAGYVYCQQFDSLLVFTKQGTKLRSYTTEDGEVRQYLVHPDGGRLLVLTSSKLFHIGVPFSPQ